MKTQKKSLSALGIVNLIETAKKFGIPIQPILDRYNIEENMLPTLESRIDFDDFAEIFNYCQNYYGPKFPLHMAKETQVGKFSVLDYAIANCAALGEAYQTLVKYWNLISSVSNYKLKIIDNKVYLGTRYPDYLMRKAPTLVEMTISRILNLGRAITETEWIPNKVLLQNSLTDAREYEKTFKTVVLNDQRESTIIFDKLLLDLPVKQSNKELKKIMEASTKRLYSTLPGNDGILKAVIQAIKHNLEPQKFSIENIANKLNLSVRTLQRKLSDIGTSYNEVLVKIRAADAEILLAEKGITIDQIASLLGYNDVSAFYKFFKKQFGCTPEEYRKTFKKMN